MIPMLEKGGYTVIDPGPYQDGASDYSAQIELFKKEQCEIYNSFPLPPDFPVFWRQAALAGWTKMVKICQINKAGLVPTDIAAMGSLGYRISCTLYWHKAWPYKSLLTGQTCGALADDYEKATGNQWLQQLGASLALFEVAVETLKASGSPNDKAAVAKAVATLNIVTVNGKVQFGSGPVPNVAVMPVLCFQYMKAKSGPFKLDLIITENALDANVAVQGKLVPYSS
jgi:branched-chain amino acid transport system substrate-binding protein